MWDIRKGWRKRASLSRRNTWGKVAITVSCEKTEHAGPYKTMCVKIIDRYRWSALQKEMHTRNMEMRQPFAEKTGNILSEFEFPEVN